MAIQYNITATNARLQAVADWFSGGNFLLRNATNGTLVTIGSQAATVDSAVLSFAAPLSATVAITGEAVLGLMTDIAGSVGISSLSVGTPIGDEQILISNSSNSTVLTADQTAVFLSGQVTSSYT